jgi:hypothetical protein
MKHVFLYIILILSVLNPAAGFSSDYLPPDYSLYIEKYYQLLSKGNQDEKKLALSNLPHFLAD